MLNQFYPKVISMGNCLKPYKDIIEKLEEEKREFKQDVQIRKMTKEKSYRNIIA